ncbi:hypothetical protein TW95_gp0717 [Pandoravirus inopinatum]|uniref:Uncharacterized protein n=1 Tax=Pandoravirus inopinatum TaxID=1605721 RepID=A0A0B5J9B2_9VIRU|nr:hypothetical protein TW95_gp0717 [Pandoravirus inopinatum]AJF97451.1 hypothetical protein [Pandoravirus inopinatum]
MHYETILPMEMQYAVALSVGKSCPRALLHLGASSKSQHAIVSAVVKDLVGHPRLAAIDHIAVLRSLIRTDSGRRLRHLRIAMRLRLIQGFVTLVLRARRGNIDHVAASIMATEAAGPRAPSAADLVRHLSMALASDKALLSGNQPTDTDDHVDALLLHAWGRHMDQDFCRKHDACYPLVPSQTTQIDRVLVSLVMDGWRYPCLSRAYLYHIGLMVERGRVIEIGSPDSRRATPDNLFVIAPYADVVGQACGESSLAIDTDALKAWACGTSNSATNQAIDTLTSAAFGERLARIFDKHIHRNIATAYDCDPDRLVLPSFSVLFKPRYYLVPTWFKRTILAVSLERMDAD